MSRQGLLNPFLRHFLRLLLGSLIVIFLFAIVGLVLYRSGLGTFSQALSTAFFFADGGAIFALGGHLFISEGASGAAKSGMYALRSAGLEKTDSLFEQDERSALNPSAGRILMSVLFALLFLGSAILLSLVPPNANDIVLWIVVLVIVVLAIVVGLDSGIRAIRSM